MRLPTKYLASIQQREEGIIKVFTVSDAEEMSMLFFRCMQDVLLCGLRPRAEFQSIHLGHSTG